MTTPPSGSPISSTKPTLKFVPPTSMLKNLPFSLPLGSGVTGVTRKCSMSMPATPVKLMKAYPTSEVTSVLRVGHLMIKRRE